MKYQHITVKVNKFKVIRSLLVEVVSGCVKPLSNCPIFDQWPLMHEINIEYINSAFILAAENSTKEFAWIMKYY